METRAFAPLYTRATASANGTLQASVTVAATASAQPSAQLGLSTPNAMCQIEICNTTASWAYVNFGQFGAVTAATVATGYPIAPGSDKIISVDSEVNGASVILAAGTGNVTFTRGEGV